jgi:hypothetical protein
VETEALDELVWTTPTTIAGALALLELLSELRRARAFLDDDQADAIIISVIDAWTTYIRTRGWQTWRRCDGHERC